MIPWQPELKQSKTAARRGDFGTDTFLSNTKVSGGNTLTDTRRSQSRWAFKIITDAHYNLFFRVTFLFYFLLVHPFVFMLLRADCKRKHLDGFGLLVVANEKSKKLGTDLTAEEIG